MKVNLTYMVSAMSHCHNTILNGNQNSKIHFSFSGTDVKCQENEMMQHVVQ